MRILLILVSLALFCSCQPSGPTIYEGTAHAFVTGGEDSDTLNTCHCWQAADSLVLYVSHGPFMGIAVKIIGKNNLYDASLEYYSDTNEFDGEFTLGVPVEEDSLIVTFKEVGDSTRINGFFEITSQPVKFYDDRTIQTSGTFNCMFKSEL